MADAPVVHIGENSPQQVAYKLLEVIARVEGVSFYRSGGSGEAAATRKWLLDTYAECFEAVRGGRSWE